MDGNKLQHQLVGQQPTFRTIEKLTDKELELRDSPTQSLILERVGGANAGVAAASPSASSSTGRSPEQDVNTLSSNQQDQERLERYAEITLSSYRFDDPTIVLSGSLKSLGASAQVLPDRTAIRKAWTQREWGALAKLLHRGESLVREEQVSGMLRDLERIQLFISVKTERPLSSRRHLYLVETLSGQNGRELTDHPGESWQPHPNGDGWIHEINRSAQSVMVLATNEADDINIHSTIKHYSDWEGLSRSGKTAEFEKLEKRRALGLITAEQVAEAKRQLNENEVNAALEWARRY